MRLAELVCRKCPPSVQPAVRVVLLELAVEVPHIERHEVGDEVELVPALERARRRCSSTPRGWARQRRAGRSDGGRSVGPVSGRSEVGAARSV